MEVGLQSTTKTSTSGNSRATAIARSPFPAPTSSTRTRSALLTLWLDNDLESYKQFKKKGRCLATSYVKIESAKSTFWLYNLIWQPARNKKLPLLSSYRRADKNHCTFKKKQGDNAVGDNAVYGLPKTCPRKKPECLGLGLGIGLGSGLGLGLKSLQIFSLEPTWGIFFNIMYSTRRGSSSMTLGSNPWKQNGEQRKAVDKHTCEITYDIWVRLRPLCDPGIDDPRSQIQEKNGGQAPCSRSKKKPFNVATWGFSQKWPNA